MSDGREWVALLRRHYLHVLDGGSLSHRDMARHVEAAEAAQARIEELEEELQRRTWELWRLRQWARRQRGAGFAFTEIEAQYEDAMADEPPG